MKILRNNKDVLTFVGYIEGEWPFIEGEKKARMLPVLNLMDPEVFGTYRVYTMSDEEYKAVVGP